MPALRTDRDEYTARLVGELFAITIDFNTLAARLNALATDLRAAHPAVPGE